MWRALAIFSGLVLVSWIEFELIPGHTYLQSTSQLYVPILEYLDNPNYLTRDLVATHPNVAFTAYDEATRLLSDVIRFDFRRGLAAQQFICRLAGLLGIFLLARACGAKVLLSVAAATLINLGTYLPGASVFLIDPEPVPRAFAFGLLLLAVGLLACEKPLLAGLSGGLGLLYDPAIATPFWLVVVVAFVSDARMRKLLRPLMPIFLVFILLLANLAQLQPGTPDSRAWFTSLASDVVLITKYCSPDLWISLWPGKFIHLYFALYVLGVWALTRIWPALNRQTKWMLGSLPAFGVLSMPLSFILLEHLRWPFALRVQPMHVLLFTVALTWLACALAAASALTKHAGVEAAVWIAICLMVLVFGGSKINRQRSDPAVLQLARWAESETWGSSMFLFPNAGRELHPGVFRAESRRALWIDWESRRQMNADIALAPEWWRRWQGAMEDPLSGDHLQQMLALPVDYYVFQRADLVAAVTEGKRHPVKPVFINSRFAVYEASSLRTVPGVLTVLGAKP